MWMIRRPWRQCCGWLSLGQKHVCCSKEEVLDVTADSPDVEDSKVAEAMLRVCLERMHFCGLKEEVLEVIPGSRDVDDTKAAAERV